MSEIPSNIFREYDIRGVADTDLASPIVERIAMGFGTWLRAKNVGKVVIGGDVRISTPRIREALASGLAAVGVDVVDIGVVTTPMLYWSLFKLGLEGGIMVTGSHNPKDMNGLKLAYGKTTIWGDDIQQVRELTVGGKFAVPERRGNFSRADIGDAYTDMLADKIKLSRKLRVAYDCGNGTAGAFFAQFLRKIGCEGLPLFEEQDGRFPNHHPDPQKRENLQQLIKQVKDGGADVGVAFDGDADRIGVVDENGSVIWGDRLMALYWGEILPKHPGATVLVEIKCSQALPEEASRLGGKTVYSRCGHSVLKAKMREVGAPFAGEYSGHMFFADEYYGYDDSFYAAGRLFRIIASSGKKLSELMAHIPEYPTTQESRVDCPDSEKFALIERVREKAARQYNVIDCDGARIVYPDGWGLIRASNTQPVISTRCEGRTREALERIMADVKARIVGEGLSDFQWEF